MKILFLRRYNARLGNGIREGIGIRIIIPILSVSHFVITDLLNIRITTWQHHFLLVQLCHVQVENDKNRLEKTTIEKELRFSYE